MLLHACIFLNTYSECFSFAVYLRVCGKLRERIRSAICPVLAICFFYLGTSASLLAKELDFEVHNYRSCLFADSTKRIYRTCRDAYFRFCTFMGYSPLPASSPIICQYASFLARTMRFSSINN